MKQVLVTGGTLFVSRYVAEYYVRKGWKVFVLNRNSRPQPEGVTLIEADRHCLGESLRNYRFDVVFDINAYRGSDVSALLDALGGWDQYILISSSAVYPDSAPQPFGEDTPLGENKFWGGYGTGKAEAEQVLLSRDPGAYILRPPYLYGPMNHIYREAFVFDCALAGRKFCLPGSGAMKLQFFHVEDLCRFMDALLQVRPRQRVFNVGNPEAVSVAEWVRLCYGLLGKQPEFLQIPPETDQRRYFCFHYYEYFLDVSAQAVLMPETIPLEAGLRDSLDWYLAHSGEIWRKPYLEFIDNELK